MLTYLLLLPLLLASVKLVLLLIDDSESFHE